MTHPDSTMTTEQNAATSAAARVRPFTAGDTVRHAPTKETWILACDEERGEVMPCGWPMCIAKASDCSLVTAAPDEERTVMLKTWAEKQGSESNRDWRTLTARRQWPNSD